MPQKEYKVPGLANPVYVLHEEDWSGMATVEWWDHTYHRVEIPAALILMVSFHETRDFVLTGISHHLETLINDLPNGKRRT